MSIQSLKNIITNLGYTRNSIELGNISQFVPGQLEQIRSLVISEMEETPAALQLIKLIESVDYETFTVEMLEGISMFVTDSLDDGRLRERIVDTINHTEYEENGQNSADHN